METLPALLTSAIVKSSLPRSISSFAAAESIRSNDARLRPCKGTRLGPPTAVSMFIARRSDSISSSHTRRQSLSLKRANWSVNRSPGRFESGLSAGACAGRWRGRCASILDDQFGRPRADDHRRSVGVPGNRRWEDRRVHHPEAADAVHSAAAVHRGIGARRAHGACPGAMQAWAHHPFELLQQILVAEPLVPRVTLLADIALQRRRCGNPAQSPYQEKRLRFVALV